MQLALPKVRLLLRLCSGFLTLHSSIIKSLGTIVRIEYYVYIWVCFIHILYIISYST